MNRFAVFSVFTLLATLTGCAKRVECNVHGGDAWIDAQTQHFHIRTNLPPDEVQQQAQRLESLLTVIHHLHRSEVKGDEKIEVVILAKREQLQEYTELLGYAQRGGLFVLAAADKEADAQIQKAIPVWKLSSTLTHELAHNVHGNVLLRSPRWIAEGFATYEETIELSPQGKFALVGAEASGRLQGVYFHGVLGLEDLWSWGQLESGGSDELREYESSWIWVHFLFNRRRPDMDAWLARLGTSEDPRKSFDAVFGSDYGKLKKELDAYLESRSYQLIQIPLEEQQELKLTTAPLSPARVHLARADLAQTAPSSDDAEDRAEKAAREVKLALQLDPKDWQVKLAAAKTAETREQRLAMAKALTEEEPTRAEVWFALAQERMRGAQYKDIVEPLRKTLALDPNHAEALGSLAWFMAGEGENLPEAKAFAERASQREPWNPQWLDSLALVLSKNGECAAAVEKQTRALEFLSEYSADKIRADYEKRLAEYKGGCKGDGAAK